MLVAAEVAHTTVFLLQQLLARVVLEAAVQALLTGLFQPQRVLLTLVVVVAVLAAVAVAVVRLAALA